MGSVYHVVQRHQLSGLSLVLLLLTAPYVSVLAADPVRLRNFSVIAFDLVFIAPLLLGVWRKRRTRRGETGNFAARPVISAASGAGRVKVRTIGLVGAASFAACYAAAPASGADLNTVWYSVFHPALDLVRGWSGSIARFEHELEADGRADDALLAGYNLAMLWIFPGLAILAGFLWRWSDIDAAQASRLRALYRSRFSGTEVLRKVIDRGIVVLFVWNMPLTGAAATNASRGITVMAQTIEFLFVGARGATLLLLCCIGLEWLFAELALMNQRNRWSARLRIGMGYGSIGS